MGEGIVCVCGEVSEGTILAAIAGGADTVTAVAESTGACGNCGDCRYDIEELLALGGRVGRPAWPRSPPDHCAMRR
jgi:NAD(P)H-nitrite reductase large subunit